MDEGAARQVRLSKGKEQSKKKRNQVIPIGKRKRRKRNEKLTKVERKRRV
jgi:hypothetical protein